MRNLRANFTGFFPIALRANFKEIYQVGAALIHTHNVALQRFNWGLCK
ncbi:hypothetical protein MADA3029_1090011 [Vibrio nigripulchritudo MADA3029]|nr:hypothetical protein VIBNIMADA3020_250041 [Vibrio nigripulchritudo MADA3020]CCN57261.1 hypothetical protein MADA3029_1090011 [Vibrio nigripulchritudo MADA3029]CCN86372.1 hypothetical protein VIBNISFn27_1020075 [Vibrio nigripulchritudo SFn27]